MSQNRRGGLGRGLAALIPTGPSPASPSLGDKAADVIMGGATHAKTRVVQDSPAAVHAGVSRETPEGKTAELVPMDASYREVSIDAIDPNPRQPRQVFDEEALEELIHSIREFGLLQPIVVRPADERFEIIMGERRWRAAAAAGLETIPAIVRETDDDDLLRDALLENIHRVQLNPLEEAAAYQQLLEEFGVTQEELARRLGRSRPLISNMIRLLRLPVAVQRRVAAGVLSAGHARAILGLDGSAGEQEELAARVVAEGLSVRATEEIVALANRGDSPAPRRPARSVQPNPRLDAVAARLADRLDTKVNVAMGRGKGRLVVEFGSMDDLERIIAVIDQSGG